MSSQVNVRSAVSLRLVPCGSLKSFPVHCFLFKPGKEVDWLGQNARSRYRIPDNVQFFLQTPKDKLGVGPGDVLDALKASLDGNDDELFADTGAKPGEVTVYIDSAEPFASPNAGPSSYGRKQSIRSSVSGGSGCSKVACCSNPPSLKSASDAWQPRDPCL